MASYSLRCLQKGDSAGQRFFPLGISLARAEHLRSQWREFSFAFNQITHAIQPGLSLSSMVKNWGKIVRGLAESPRKREIKKLGLLRPAKQVSAYGAKPLERGADFF